jgi:endonuclease/exonuclease/phosphatase family metal-dependent hydrolase
VSEVKIATLNIDWGRKSRSRNHFKKIEEILNEQIFDFLILTEAIELNLPAYKYRYSSEKIPENQVYEGLNYTEYLHGEKAFRTMIYSKIPSINKYDVLDGKTSLAHEFQTEFGDFVIYSTVVGTWFNKEPYAKNELENCLTDCERIQKINPNLMIVGDLNTSFQASEKEYTINPETTKSLNGLFKKLNLINATGQIEKNMITS